MPVVAAKLLILVLNVAKLPPVLNELPFRYSVPTGNDAVGVHVIVAQLAFHSGDPTSTHCPAST